MGADEMMATLARIARREPQVAARALGRRAEVVMAESQRLVPVESGDLKRTGKVNKPVVSPSKVSVTMHYGSEHPASMYAVAVHEFPARRPAPWQGASVNFSPGGPKYLERPLLAERGRMISEMARDLNVDRWAR